MKDLLGTWIIDPEARVDQIVIIDFKENGQLIYTIVEEEKNNVMLLNYRVENGTIISDQPSAPKEEKTKFQITNEGKLILTFGKESYQYIRLSQPFLNNSS